MPIRIRKASRHGSDVAHAAVSSPVSGLPASAVAAPKVRACYGLCGRFYSRLTVASQERRCFRRRFEDEGGWVRAGHAETAHLRGAQYLGTLA